MMVFCHSCGKASEHLGPLGRRDTCPHCDAELRCCLQCSLYDPESANTCREPQAEEMRDKDRGNFCEFFTLGTGARQERSDAASAKEAFEALFKKKG
jgi:hypothetical protein